MGEQIATSRAGTTAPLVLDLDFAMDVQKLQNEFTRALRFYQDCMQKLKLDPQNSEYQQNVAESQKQIVAIDLKQKLFVKQFREKSSHMTPAVLSSENNKLGGGKVKKEEEEKGLKSVERNSNNETVVVVNGSNHYTPPNSEDEHSDVSRSVSTVGSCGISICTDSISCPSSVSNTPLSSRPSSPVINSKSSSNSSQPTFPSDVMEQEEFLKGFGLITHESLKSQSETKRVERRRRTTANPKYNTNGFVDLSQISRRTRRLEESGEADVVVSSPKRMTLIASVKSKYSEPKCIVCEQPDCNLTCESCEAQLHVDCIRVSGSKAPAPTRLHHCPRCIVALNESQRFAPSSSSSSSSSSSNDDYVKFQKPLIPTTPIIPANLKKKSLPSSSTIGGNEEDSSSESKTVTSSSTKPKLMKKIGLSVAQKSAAAATTLGNASGKASKKVSKNKKAGLKVSSSSSIINSSDSTSSKLSTKLDHLGKPLASPFKSLAALTAKGAAAAANVKKEDGISNCNGDSNSVNGNHTNIIPHLVKKKSKLNGVKAKTLSVTGGNNNSPTSKLTKPKASPLNNINSNGNIGSRPNKPLVKTSTNRLPKFNADQHLSMEKTILAMTAAAKSVMSGMKVQPVSRGNSNLDFHNNYHDKEQSAKATSAILGNNNNSTSSSSSSSNSSQSSNLLAVASPPTLSYHPPSSPPANDITTSSPKTTTTTIPEPTLSSGGGNSELNITNNCNGNLILEKQ